MPRSRLAGLACREKGVCRAPVTATLKAPAAGLYRMAASDTPAAVLSAVDERIAGDPLTPDAEAARRATHWAAPR